MQQAVDLARRLGDAGLQAHSLIRQANWLLNTRQVAEALSTNSEALALFEARQEQPGMVETLDLIGTVYNMAGDSINAALVYDRAIEYLREVGNRSKLCSCLVNRVAVAAPWGGQTCCTVNGSLAACERDLTEALQLARELEWAAGEVFVEIYFGEMLACFGCLGAGLAHEQHALHLAIEISHQQWIAGAHDALARIALSLLASEQALAHAEAGLEAARELGSTVWITYLIAEQVQAYTNLGLPKLAEERRQSLSWRRPGVARSSSSIYPCSGRSSALLGERTRDRGVWRRRSKHSPQRARELAHWGEHRGSGAALALRAGSARDAAEGKSRLSAPDHRRAV